MEKKFLKSSTSASPLSAAVQVGDTLYVSGQLAISPETKKMISDDVTEQTEQVMKNLQSVVENAGFKISDIIKTTVYVADGADMPAVNAAYKKFFDEDALPARCAFQVVFPNKAVKVEIEAVAVK